MFYKTRATNKSRFIFDIKTANKLPVFPVIHKNLNINPYITLNISETLANTANNCMSLPMIYTNDATKKSFTDYYGVADLDTFRWRFNLFTEK